MGPTNITGTALLASDLTQHNIEPVQSEIMHKESPSPPVPAKPNTLYSRGSFVAIVCWIVG